MSNYRHHDYDDDKPSLLLNERVVWISDNGPQYGTVRWLGKLLDLGKEWMAGVEFDNPVGTGTGLYKDTQLFVTEMNHASLVPIIGLLKASDFDGPVVAPTRDSSTRLIDFNTEPMIESREIKPFGVETKARESFNDAFQLLQDQSDRLQISRTSRSGSKAAHQRERQIPIMLEDDVVDHNLKAQSMIGKSGLVPAPSNSKIELTTKKQHDNKNAIKELTRAFNQTNLRDESNFIVSHGVPSLPPPALIVHEGDNNPSHTLRNSLGKSKGIQGHNNSCYLDATLFAMFSSTTLFDSLLYRPPNRNDIPEYREIQKILREDIVRPLRETHIVCADQVMKFRTLLERSSKVEGLTDEEKDPEEFLSLLLGQILKAEPYLKLSSGLESFLYQLIVEKDENVILPTVQDLFYQSFVESTVRLREIPSCLMMHMPRFGRQYKMYPRIMPSPKLDITDVLEAAPRSCGHRGKDCDNLALYECKDCMHEQSGRNNTRLTSITYCHNCFQSKHFGKTHITGIESHDKTKTKLNLIPSEAISRYSNKQSNTKNKEIPRICMELFAVLCIETSHYVCFVKCGTESDSPWCFFDSMADRKGEQGGYNIPEVILFEEFAFWTSEDGIAYLLDQKDDKQLPDMPKRLICDAYLCFYQYNGLATFR